jgi:hypothetical protein
MLTRDPATLQDLLAMATSILRIQLEVDRLKAEVAEMRATKPAKTMTDRLTVVVELAKLIGQFLNTPVGATIMGFVIAAAGVVVRWLRGGG